MKKSFVISLGVVLGVGIIGAGGYYLYQQHARSVEVAAVRKVATTYTRAFEKQQYAKLAKQVNVKTLKGYTAKTLAARNQAVFERMGASNVKVSNLKVAAQKNGTYSMRFNVKMSTSLGALTQKHYQTTLRKVAGKLRLDWSPRMILPQLSGKATVQLTTEAATRGRILDRNGKALAENGTVAEAGMIRGQLGTGATLASNLQKISAAFKVDVASLKTLLAQSWVTDDNFVPIKVVTDNPTLTGVTYQSVTQRTYATGEASAQLIGYVGEVTAEDLQKHPSYHTGEIIGKAGLEKTYNKELAGQTGGKLTIVAESGKTTTLISRQEKDGQDIQLTIDSALQTKAYNQLKGKKGAVVTLDPKSGALLTLVSTPSYDPNKFVSGISQSDYDKYANDAAHPFVSRYTQRYAPGSTFKMLTAGVALDNGTITASTTKNIKGLKWQKDSSWGDYQVTRVDDVAPENLTQALLHSDNIWFAQTALKMGKSAFLKGIAPFFKQKNQLPLTMAAPQLSNSGKLAKEVLFADTAYGQGQILMSPIQQAVAYTAVMNGGQMQAPSLLLNKTGKTTQVLKTSTAATLKQALTQVVDNSAGTAHGLQLSGHSIAAKTGTAELKAKQGVDGTTNGFLMAADADNDSYLMLAMIENAGSKDVVTTMKPFVADLY